MNEVVAELVKILPESQWLRFLLIVFIVMLIVLREKLFTGGLLCVRYLWRWAGCRIGKHSWKHVFGVNGYSQYACRICHRSKTVDRR